MCECVVLWPLGDAPHSVMIEFVGGGVGGDIKPDTPWNKTHLAVTNARAIQKIVEPRVFSPPTRLAHLCRRARDHEKLTGLVSDS